MKTSPYLFLLIIFGLIFSKVLAMSVTQGSGGIGGTFAPAGFNSNAPFLEGNYKIGFALASYKFVVANTSLYADGFPNVILRTNSIPLALVAEASLCRTLFPRLSRVRLLLFSSRILLAFLLARVLAE